MIDSKMQNLINEYIESAKQFYPELQLLTWANMYSENEDLGTIVEFGNADTALKNAYSINNEKYFIHYTSIDSLFGILNSCQLRLHNLYSLNDPMELKFSLADVGLNSPFDIDFYKRAMFVTSFCGYDDIKRNENYNMWRLYGKNGYGAALVFEIENYSENWDNYFFGKVQYGNNNPALKNLKNFINFHNNFKINHRRLSRIPEFIAILCLMHKHTVWEIENEDRLFANFRFNEVSLKEWIQLVIIF
jgi:hypothetical protein